MNIADKRQLKCSSYTVQSVWSDYVLLLPLESFVMFFEALTELAVVFNALDHTNYTLDSCASARHGGTADNPPQNSQRISSWEFYRPEDKQAILRYPGDQVHDRRTVQSSMKTEVQ